LIPKYVAGVVAAGLSLAGHVALIEYGGADMERFVSAASAPNVLTATLRAEPRTKAVLEKSSSVDRPNAAYEVRQSLVIADSAEDEKLFPAFYSVRYYDTKELSRKPFVTLDIPRDFALTVPGVPEDAAVLLLLINEYGDVDKVVVENSRLPQTAQTTLGDTLSSMKFSPGEIEGVPVKSRMKIRIRLAPEKN
jgi:hypothetical protein